MTSVPWLPLSQLFDAFADIRGVGLSKMTKALYPKRPALIPMLDSMVQTYRERTTSAPRLRSRSARSGSSAATNVTWTATGRAVRAVRQELARCGYGLTEVRILDLLIWSAQAAAWAARPLRPGAVASRLPVSERTIHNLSLRYRRLCVPMSGRRHLCLPAPNRAMAVSMPRCLVSALLAAAMVSA